MRNLNAWALVRPGGTHSAWVHTQPPTDSFVNAADQTGYVPPDIGQHFGGGGNVKRVIEGIFSRNPRMQGSDVTRAVSRTLSGYALGLRS